MIVRVYSRKNRTLLLLVTLCIIALGLDGWQQAARRTGRGTALDNVVCSVSAPLQTGLITGARLMEKEWLAMFRARELEKENAKLAARIAALEDKLSQATEKQRASERERALKEAYPTAPQALVARVIGVGSGGWSDFFTLDVGRLHGVQIKQPVVTREGLVGQVYAVTNQSCRVVPLTAPSSSVAVRLERSRDSGVLKGLGDWRCEIHYLGPEADVRAGDLVMTSGIGGIYPKGLRIGKVTAVRPDEYTPGKIAEVELAASLRRTEEVLLLSR